MNSGNSRICSMKKNKYLLLASSLGTLALLVAAAIQENFRKEWRQIQASAHSGEGAIRVQLRQIVNPGLGISDRCISCHVSMAPGDEGVHGAPVLAAHKPVVHDPADYGCTVCHSGQGEASEKADAHGSVHFWPEPMIPARFSYAGCGTCHTPLNIPASPVLKRATHAFERLDCLACHRMDGRGGTIRPDGGGMEGPDLSHTGLSRYDPAWYDKHLAQSQDATGGPWKASFAPITESDRELLATFLSTRIGAPELIEAKATFHSAGCLGCHKVSGVGGDEGLDLSRAGEKDPGQLHFAHVHGKATVENWFAEHFRSPASVVAGSQMPPVALPPPKIEALTMYMFSLRRRELPGSYLPNDRVRTVRFGEREFTNDGETIFGAFCSGCHGTDGMGRRAPGNGAFPAIAHPDFLSRASDEFLLHTVTKGRPGRRMPAWGEKEGGLRPEEIRRVVAHVRKLGGVEAKPDTLPQRWLRADPAAGRQLFAAVCSGCHGPRGEGGEGPALNNRVLLNTASDTYLVGTIGMGRRGTAMEGFLTPSPVRPALSPAEIETIAAFIRSWEGGNK
jgi:mono/diheme cytochrome c family protein